MISDQNTSNSPSLEEQIVSLTQTVQSNRESLDDATRFRAVKAARGLLEVLNSPPETVMQDVVLVCDKNIHREAPCRTSIMSALIVNPLTRP